ncbi:hypothetical protein AXF42_Ash020779 [Apostasia shenzhenica]|uniref:Uncharacterized protein n=1 Tax=Apostasia shenzhenica TaxID=1088818 RepID=A0A2I0A4I9_9ASPA|nr:hypothetical protein AXF42_Ash020779 [Apostasia shenzhenica]
MSVNPPELFPAFAGTDIGSNSSSDDDYGDFVFSSPCSLHAPPTIPSSALALDAAADEDDWGDFLAIPLGSQSFHLQSSSPSSLPFDPSSDAFPADPSSRFGEEEPEEPEQIEGPGVLGNGFDSSPSRNHSSLKRAPSGQLKDLIENLYGQDCDYGCIFQDIKEVRWTIWDNHDLNLTTDAVGKNDSNGKFEDHIKHDTDGRTDSSPVSVSEILGNLYDKANRLQCNGHSHGHANNGKEMDQHRQSSAYINGDDHFDQFDWDFRSAAGTGETEKLPDHESQSFPNVSTSCNIVVSYCRLKEESLSFIAHHLRALKVWCTLHNENLKLYFLECKLCNIEIINSYRFLLFQRTHLT